MASSALSQLNSLAKRRFKWKRDTNIEEHRNLRKNWSDTQKIQIIRDGEYIKMFVIIDENQILFKTTRNDKRNLFSKVGQTMFVN